MRYPFVSLIVVGFLLLGRELLWKGNSTSNLPHNATVEAESVKTFTVVAPVAPNWSEPISTGIKTSFYPEKGFITLKKDSGDKVRNIHREGGPEVGSTLTAEFQSEGTSPVNVIVTVTVR